MNSHSRARLPSCGASGQNLNLGPLTTYFPHLIALCMYSVAFKYLSGIERKATTHSCNIIHNCNLARNPEIQGLFCPDPVFAHSSKKGQLQHLFPETELLLLCIIQRACCQFSEGLFLHLKVVPLKSVTTRSGLFRVTKPTKTQTICMAIHH